MANKKKSVNKGTGKDNICGVTLSNGKYFCIDCGCELKVDQDCPECKRQVDWERAIIELHPRTL
jgi:hypothetical protein